MSKTNDSKFLCYVLRHQPDKIGVILDENGWIPVTDLLAALQSHGKAIDRDRLQYVIDSCPKQRFALSDDGTRIRANQGHSIEVDLDLEPCRPPPLLFHGTVGRFMDSIRGEGLTRGSRHHVHLSEELVREFWTTPLSKAMLP
ncbi:MAG: putative RNA 2'-phosphotransferase [Rhodothermales bacterium]|jgi:putative RNA 2'-phosphotransferase